MPPPDPMQISAPTFAPQGQDAKAALAEAVKGLTYPSESDAPFNVISAEDTTAPNAEEFVKRQAKATGKVVEISVDQFFRELDGTEDSDRFRNLRRDAVGLEGAKSRVGEEDRRVLGGQGTLWRLGRTAHHFRRDVTCATDARELTPPDKSEPRVGPQEGPKATRSSNSYCEQPASYKSSNGPALAPSGTLREPRYWPRSTRRRGGTVLALAFGGQAPGYRTKGQGAETPPACFSPPDARRRLLPFIFL